MISKRALRRHQAVTHMKRRLKEDRNQHYDNLTCVCRTDAKAMARFKEQPKLCSCYMCGNPRKFFNEVTRQERLNKDSLRHGKISDLG